MFVVWAWSRKDNYLKPWFVGVFSKESLANKAIKADRARKKHVRPAYEIERDAELDREAGYSIGRF